MKILAVLPLIPWPLDRGDRMRAWELVHEMSHYGELHVAVVGRETLNSEARAALAGVAVSVHVHDAGSALFNAVRGILWGLPPGLGAYWRPRLGRSLGGDAHWDLVVAFQLRTAPYALRATARFRAIDLTDSLAMFRRTLPARGRSGLLKVMLWGIDRIEARVPAQFDLCWISADDDAQAVADLSGIRPGIVPNGCEPVDVLAPYRTDGTLLFVGDMRYPANEDGILSFIRTIWPRLGRDGAQLRIVGRPTAKVIQAGRQPAIDLVGAIPDLSPELARATAVINPVRFGSGSSRKVLTGWASGRPVISTRAGARGLHYVPGADILIADTPEQWAAAVEWVTANPRSAAALGQAGWARARESHDARRVWSQALQTASLGPVVASSGRVVPAPRWRSRVSPGWPSTRR